MARIKVEAVRVPINIPKDLVDYLDHKAEVQGYGATRSSIVRDLILKDKREHENGEKDSNR